MRHSQKIDKSWKKKMEKNNNNGKEITVDGLARIMTEGFKESEKLMDKKMEKLATSIQKEFLELKDEIKGVKEEIKEVKSDTKAIKADLNKGVDRFEHNELIYRVEKLEKKFA